MCLSTESLKLMFVVHQRSIRQCEKLSDGLMIRLSSHTLTSTVLPCIRRQCAGQGMSHVANGSIALALRVAHGPSVPDQDTAWRRYASALVMPSTIITHWRMQKHRDTSCSQRCATAASILVR